MHKKILVIDDEPDFRDIMTDYLSLNGYTTLEAENGMQGLEVMDKEKPDVVLLDIRMPKMNGVEVLRAMKDRADKTITIVLSAVHEEDTAKEAIELGAYDYLTKPLNLQKFTDNYLNRIFE